MTTTKKFNPKEFKEKYRIYRPVPGALRVQRLYLWDQARGEYRIPEFGNSYEARRYEVTPEGRTVRKKKCFATLEDARLWQAGATMLSPEPTALNAAARTSISKSAGPSFRNVVAEWKKRRFPSFSETTCERYDRILALYFGSLMDVAIRELSPQRIDQWLDVLKNPDSWTMQSKKRKDFGHEVSVLSTVLRYYEEYHDDPDFRLPVKQRHWESAKLNREKKVASKDFSEEEFFLFRKTLEETKFGAVLAPLATVQYFQALRISEVAALHWEDIELNDVNPSVSRLLVRRYIVWPRFVNKPSYIKAGFKNASANQGVKEQPLFPEAYRALRELYQGGATGLVFQLNGTHLTYRILQSWYNRAFKLAGLPYRSTHVMRHGGCRNLYNEVPDLAIAQQLLGNSSIKTTTVYAKRHKGALTKVAQVKWSQLSEAGRNWSQTGESKLKTNLKSGG